MSVRQVNVEYRMSCIQRVSEIKIQGVNLELAIYKISIIQFQSGVSLSRGNPIELWASANISSNLNVWIAGLCQEWRWKHALTYFILMCNDWLTLYNFYFHEWTIIQSILRHFFLIFLNFFGKLCGRPKWFWWMHRFSVV